MRFNGRIKGLIKDWTSGKWTISFEIDESPNEEINRLSAIEHLDIDVDQHQKPKSIKANGLMWACIGQIAAALRADKMDIYKQMLRRYGKFTYKAIPPEDLEDEIEPYREYEVIGVQEDGTVELFCYEGTSTYTSREFAVLLDGIISEMKEMEISLPPKEDRDSAIENFKREECITIDAEN